MNRLNVNIAGVEFKNPIIAASGSYGFGREYNEFYPISKIGGISCKGTTLEPREGNAPPRVAETPSGMLNSVGLQNPGVEHFVKNEVPWIKQQGTVCIANIAGNAVEDYAKTAEIVNDSDVDMVELNVSCPNVKHGGMQFGTSCAGLSEVVTAVRAKLTKKPLIVKLSPNVTDITELARAAESSGADCVSLINTLLGMRIDIRTKRPILHNNVGGFSGNAVFPVAVRMVWQVRNAISVPIIGMGGVTNYKEAVEMMMAGADAIQVGTANFTDPFAMPKIIDGLQKYAEENGLNNISEIVATVKPW